MKKLVSAMLVASTMMVSAPVLATSITYIGSEKVRSINATYSITTDGTIGQLNSSDITAFTVSLMDGSDSITFNQTDGNIKEADLYSTPTYLYLSSYDSYLDFVSDIKYKYYHTILEFAFNSTNAQIADAAHSVGGFQYALEPNNVSFATAAPVVAAAVPEPAMWAMMIVGLGAIGWAMRRRQKVTMRVAYA